MFENFVQNLRKKLKTEENGTSVNHHRKYYNGQSYQEPEDYEATDKESTLTGGEYKAAIITLLFSLTVLFTKLLSGKKSSIVPTMYLSGWLGGSLLTVETFWTRWRWLLWPLFFSVSIMVYSWLMVFKNIRRFPGVEPPSPMTPTRYKKVNGTTFYLDYLLPVFISSCSFFLILYCSDQLF